MHKTMIQNFTSKLDMCNKRTDSARKDGGSQGF